MPTALENLESSKVSALQAAQHVIDNPTQIIMISALNQQLEEALDALDPNLTAIIAILSQQKDAVNNIAWYISGKNLVRDGRKAHIPPLETKESYYIQYLNHVRGAISLVDVPNLQQTLKAKEIENLRALRATPAEILDAEVIKLNTDLAITLSDNGITDAVRKIKVAKDFAGLEDEHYNITTLSNAKDKNDQEVTVIESEIMTSELTEAQHNMFGNLPNESWFTNMPSWEQNLVKRYFHELSSGAKVIPTQLRSSIPLLRNAYRKLVYINKKQPNGQLASRKILETSHSGSISTSTKGDNIALTAEIIRQAQQFTPKSATNLQITSLMSPINIFDEDAHDDRIVRAAMTDFTGVTRSVMPFNIFRNLPNGGGRDLAAAKESLIELGRYCNGKQVYPKTANFLITGSGFEAAEAEINGIESLCDRPVLQNCLEARKDIDSFGKIRALRFGENIDSRIAARMKLISSQLNALNAPFSWMHSMCKSGKDRTQLVEIEATKQALDQALGTSEAQSEANLKTVLSARSAVNIAGTQGGTPGCDAIRVSAAKHASRSIFGKVIGYFANKIANNNKFKVDKVRMNLHRIKSGMSNLLSSSKNNATTCSKLLTKQDKHQR